MNQQTVGIFIFEDVEVLDFCGPFEVFAITELNDRDWPNDLTIPFKVIMIAQTQETVRCRGGLLVQPHYSIDDHPPIEILVLPGGPGTPRVLNNTRILDWVAIQNKTVSLTTSVCTGAFILAECDLLNGRSATTHWGGIEPLRQNYPAIDVRENVRCVESGTLITSAGVSAGIDMALYVVSQLFSKEVAQKTARRMEYEWVDHDSALRYVRVGKQTGMPLASGSQ